MKVSIVRYDQLPEDERNQQPDNGSGKYEASYLKVEITGKPTSYYSDAMEPEDARFCRALHWVKSALLAAYEAGRAFSDEEPEILAERARRLAEGDEDNRPYITCHSCGRMFKIIPFGEWNDGDAASCSYCGRRHTKEMLRV